MRRGVPVSPHDFSGGRRTALLIKKIQVGHIETNCYIVSDEDTLNCAVIDPGDESNAILDYIEENKLVCGHIFITHGHFDHTMAVSAVKSETGAAVYISERDIGLAREHNRDLRTEEVAFYKEGDVISVGGLEFHVIETPGHSLGGVTLICEKSLFTGDTLFKDSCGRTDFDGGDMQVMQSSLRRLAMLEGDYDVYPGHMDSTTLERERRFNYYMRYALET